MKNVLLQAADKLNKNRRKRNWWRNAVRVMGSVVVFCTTYALILPAITMEQIPICGIEVHEHQESCYTQQPVFALSCGIEAGTQVQHHHADLCFNDQGLLICPLPEIDAHIHDDRCYSASEAPVCEVTHIHSEECSTLERMLVCQQEETEGHTHSDLCMTQTVLVCEIPASEGHAHSERCGTTQSQLICTEEEGEVHTHTELCYELVQLPCEIPEAEGHTHGEACYAVEPVECLLAECEAHFHTDECYAQQLVVCELPDAASHVHDAGCYSYELTCGQEEIQIPSHVHTQDCLVQTEETVDVLVCQQPEHIHVESCYPIEEKIEGVYESICGSGTHTHVSECYNEEGTLLCSIPEHTHDASCIVADLDLTADAETADQWTKTLEQVKLTGNWPTDVLAIAQSQLGYRESVRNVVLEGGSLMGYTRYGAWYGYPYGDWCAMYASFCLHYAGVKDYPLEAGVNTWIDALTERELYFTPDVYTPKPGDLIFFDYDQVADAQIPVRADHVGIVAELIPATETEPAKLRTIEGNTSDMVAYVTYDMDDPALIGYGKVPSGDVLYMTYEGADFTVSVTLDKQAQIPEDAVLSVREIEQGSEEYNTYYQQSVSAMLNSATAETEEELAVSFARFFDISFLVDGQIVEPQRPVHVQISYHDSINQSLEESGVAVHFADDGIEVLDAKTSQSTQEEAENIDTFHFEQGSFSVVGTVISTYARQIASDRATRVEPYSIDGSGQTLYVLYTQIGGQYYAIDGNGNPVPITVSGNTVTMGDNVTNDVFWSFSGSNNVYIISNLGTARYLHAYNNGWNNTAVTTSNPYDTTLILNGTSFRIRGAGGNYVYFPNASGAAQANTSQGNYFYVARVGQYYNVWFDGTDGGMMSYYGAADQNRPAIRNTDGTATVELPETWQSSTKYDYTLRGWYDVYNHKYYPVNPYDDVTPTATINNHTVFYADWIASTYDVGQYNEHVVESLDTNNFITTHVFDYNVLFNVMSQTQGGTISSSSHKENWTIVNNGTVPYGGNVPSLGFAFVDYDANGEFSYANGRNNINVNQGDAITPGILQNVRNRTNKDLLDLLFNPYTDVIGKYYAGQGNYLFQYMDSTTENYDGVHDGYYYLDARRNAASYNQSLQRFYLYDYLERTSDSQKDGGVGEYSDFLPFNSPYLFEADQLNEYVDRVLRPGYEYDAKDGGDNHPEYNDLDDANTNYFFGIRTDIEFFLPNDAGTTDEYGNYGNISTRGEHMIFDFHGDDDVWVLIDGELVLDIGGLHGVMFGQIDFSSGTVITGKDGGATTTVSFQELLGHNISEGTHNMTIYYMERGSSQSNCAIYFNIAPRYDLEITKEDIFSAEELDGAVFTIYNDEAMSSPAQLWESEEAHNADMADGIIDDAKSSFSVVDGIAKCWGISAGKTYYIYETTPPPGYPESDDIIRITLNNRGTATIETTTLHGANSVATEGFAVIKQDINETLKIVALTVTNQKEGEDTEVRVVKKWADGSTNLPKSILVYLTADGEPVGRMATLTAANGWSYTWTGLPKYAQEGIDQEIEYVVQEVLVPDFITTQGETLRVENYQDWIQVSQMSDSKTYLLVHNGMALSYDGSGFGWMDPETAKTDAGKAAQWNVTTDHDGFHLKNELRYTLTYGSGKFYGINNDAVALNQVIYYLNSRLVAHQNDTYYQFGANGAAVSSDGLSFTLYQKEILTGFLSTITNVPVNEEDQTYLEVTKQWSDGNELHEDTSVTMLLYADGQSTGRTLVLNAENKWTGGFYDLPYYQEDGVTVASYTVVEEPVKGYLPFYSDGTQLPSLPVTLWQGATSLVPDGVYRFTSGNDTMTEAKDHTVVPAIVDLEDLNQQWLAVNRSGSIVLQNVGTKRYLVLNGSTLSTTTNIWSATVVTLDQGKVKLGSSYLEIGSGYVQTTNNAQNVSGQQIYLRVNTFGKPGTAITVTNAPAGYELPTTGGPGVGMYIMSGWLMLSAALIYVIYFGRKRQKGGV